MLRSVLCLVVTTHILVLIGAREQNGLQLSSPDLPDYKNTLSNFMTFAGKTYFFSTIFKANYFRAQQFCRQNGMQLVSISNPIENERLGKFAQKVGAADDHFWTSGTSLSDPNHWIWLSTGNNVIYSNWHAGEPSGISPRNVSERCVEVCHYGNGFSWNDYDCYQELHFICESTSGCS